ncbi:MAG: restriction endonuclease subunit S [Thermoanaerobacteraceae bacterium]|nr:restriction endonuclease subunit S [Thermoanaerobacteraceae bacterium]
MNENIKLPEGWKVVRLGEVIEESSQRKKQQDIQVVLTISNVLGFIDQTDFFGRNLSSKDTSNYKVIRKQYFAYNPARINVGSIALNDIYDEAIVSPMYIVFKNKECLLPQYFKYHIQRKIFNFQVINSTTGSVRESLNFSRLITLNFILPPLPEQHKIAEILETVDNAIEKTDAIIEKYKRIKQGLMQDLLTRGIDENWQIRNEKTHKFKDSPLGMIPEEWEVVRLGVIGKIVSGSTPDTSKPQFWNGEIVWITPDDLSKQKKFIYTSQRKISKEGLFSCAARIIPKNSVVLSSRAPIGYLAIVKTNYTTNQGCKSIIINKDFYDEEFLYYSLHQYINKMISLGSGTTFNEINKNQLSKLDIKIPNSLPEQERIATVLSQIDEAIEKEKSYKEKLEGIKKGLMEDLLTGKVRVNHLIEEECIDEIG